MTDPQFTIESKRAHRCQRFRVYPGTSVMQGSKLLGVMAGHGGQAQYGHFLNIASEYCDASNCRFVHNDTHMTPWKPSAYYLTIFYYYFIEDFFLQVNTSVLLTKTEHCIVQLFFYLLL